jgi:fatty acid desaturase
MKLLDDQQLKKVPWKDLVKLNRKEVFIENSVGIPWLALSLIFAWQHWYWAALPCSFMFFLTALRVVHNGFHKTLGLSGAVNEATLYVYSILMCVSVHAVKYNHLRHHKYCLEEEDVEGSCARMHWCKALFYGPLFIVKIHKAALQSGKKDVRRKVMLELLMVALYASAAFYFNVAVLQYHILVMLAGELFSSFFAVWTVHHDCDDYLFARTQRGWWKNFFTYSMFYHLEHHLFPAVPTGKLQELSKRIEKECPHIKVKEVF